MTADFMEASHPRKIGDVYCSDQIDPVTGKPHYYRVVEVFPGGGNSSVWCNEAGETITRTIKEDSGGKIISVTDTAS